MDTVPRVPPLRHHPAMKETRALIHSPDDPVGALSLFRVRLAHPELDLNELIFQALDALLRVTGDRVVRLRMQDSGGNLQGLLVLSGGCLCTLDLSAHHACTLQFELHGRRGQLQYDETPDSGVWFQPVAEAFHNLRPWTDLCELVSGEQQTPPSYIEVEKIRRAALDSLAGQEIWEAVEGKA